jgi:D-alanine-D-alanine ligase
MNSLSNKHIAVLMGGPGSERKVSLASGAGVAMALRGRGAVVTEVDVADENFALPADIEIAFNVIHGTFGEDGKLQALLEKRGVAYTGEGVESSRMAFDKNATKRRLIERGVPTPRFEIISAGAQPTLPLPLVVKTPCEGSSVGVYIVKQPEELAPALEGAAKFADEILVEEYVVGHELTVGILGDLALPVIEICPKEGFYDFANKYPFLNPKAAGADHLCPAPIGDEATARVQQAALAAHRALGLEVYSRVDVLLGADGAPFVLEINTIPGMTEASLLPEAAGVAGIGYGELCERIIALSLARRRRA